MILCTGPWTVTWACAVLWAQAWIWSSWQADSAMIVAFINYPRSDPILSKTSLLALSVIYIPEVDNWQADVLSWQGLDTENKRLSSLSGSKRRAFRWFLSLLIGRANVELGPGKPPSGRFSMGTTWSSRSSVLRTNLPSFFSVASINSMVVDAQDFINGHPWVGDSYNVKR